MSFNFVSIKNICSWALKSQIPRRHLNPFQLTRLSSNITGGNVKEDIKDIEDFREEPQNTSGINRGEMSADTSENFEKCINEVRLMGRVTSIFFSPDNSRKMFKLQTKRRVVSSETGERKEIPEWHTLVSYQQKKLEEMERLIRTGQRIFVSGRLTYRTNREGERSANIMVNDFVIVDP